MVFYTPFDVGYKVGKFLPVKIIASAMKEIYRCKKIHDGVTHAAKLYPNAFIIMIIIGTLKGNGAGFTKLLERLIRGAWTPTAMEFMQPSLYELLYTLQQNLYFVPFYTRITFTIAATQKRLLWHPSYLCWTKRPISFRHHMHWSTLES